MNRIGENQLARSILVDINQNKELYNKYSNEVSSGLKVSDPGDSNFSGTISAYRESLNKIEANKTRIAAVQGQLSFQDSIMQQASDLMVRAKELSAQGVNETLGVNQREQMSAEVFTLRDSLLSLANTQYQGKYIYGGAEDSHPPYNAQVYAVPATGPASQRYTYDDTTTNPAAALTKSVNVTDDVAITINTPGNKLFDNAMQALERFCLLYTSDAADE